MKKAFIILGTLAILSFSPASAHDDGVSAPVPENGISWEVFESSQSIEWHDPETNTTRIRPEFSEEVKALDNKDITVSGFMMPIDESKAEQSRFILFQFQPDCFFHMAMGPTHFIEIVSKKPIANTDQALVLKGTLKLVKEKKGGIFYRIDNGQIVDAI